MNEEKKSGADQKENKVATLTSSAVKKSIQDQDDDDDIYDDNKKRMSLYGTISHHTLIISCYHLISPLIRSVICVYMSGDAFALYENALKQIRDELKELVRTSTLIHLYSASIND